MELRTKIPLPTWLLAAFVLIGGLVAVPAHAGAAGAVEITEAPDLQWGLKQSWRLYVPPPQTSGGAQVVAPAPGGYQVSWQFDSGTFDPADGSTVLRYEGTAHWLKYPAEDFAALKPPSYSGPMDIHILDVSVSDPVVRISRDGATVEAEADSRRIDSWEIEHFDAVRLADLDVSAVTPTVDGDTTTWAGIPAVSGPDTPDVFAGNYRQGVAVDAVGFSYAGPGGAPDFSEHWDPPGTAKLELDGNTILTEEGLDRVFKPWLIDRDHGIIHFTNQNQSNTGLVYRAFSLDTLQPLGEPIDIPISSADNPAQTMFYDSNTGRLFFQSSGQTRWMKYDHAQGEYVFGVVDQPFPLVGNRSMMWDAVGRRVFNFVRFKPDGVANNDFDNHQWQLNTYTEQPDGSWVRTTYSVPNAPTGLNQNRYPLSSSFNSPAGLAAPDGSLVVLGMRQTSNSAGVPVPATAPGAYRIRIDEALGVADVEEIDGTEFVNDTANGSFSQLQSGPGGQMVLSDNEGGGLAARVQSIVVGDSDVTVEPPVVLEGFETAGLTGFAVDPADGTVWVGGNWAQRLLGIVGGRVVADQYFAERHPRGGPVMVGADHKVYAQTNDGSPAELGGSQIFGMGEFRRLGFSPGVATDPSPRQAELGVGEEAAPVMFTSSAVGDPAPARQWQSKRPGTSRFTDLEGETGETLTVDVEPGMDGTEYRAVYENAAGRIASEAATLGVDYAPRIVIDVLGTSVVEGSKAEFSVLSDGKPEPEISWQRRVGGFWQTIDPDDDNFEIDGPSLTVIETNTDQSGSLFRARLRNSLGTVNSQAASLTVNPKVAIPPGGLDLQDVSLEWTGNEEMQKAPPFGASNYFSAGASDGDEASYRSVDGNAAVYQMSSSGAESLATWPTRTTHVGSGGEQVARLYGGDARIEPDGSATVHWDGAFSVNFYGGLVPFTVADPELTVDAGGSGELSADLSGYASSQANPNERSPLAPVADVTIATFSGVEVDPDGEIAIEPDYAGVEVDVSVPFAPQSTGAGWGAWPQPFVDFHAKTGLAPYWYSSGSPFDPYKQPDPLVVDFDGDPALAEPADDSPLAGAGSSSQPSRMGAPPEATASIAVPMRAGTVGRGRIARLAMLSCPQSDFCTVATPRRVRVRIAGRTFWARVIAPRAIEPGSSAAVKLKLSKAALKSLDGRAATGRVPVVVRSGSSWVERVVAVRLTRRASNSTTGNGAN